MSDESKHTPGSEWKLKITHPEGDFCGMVSVTIGGEVAYSAVYSEGEERAVADAYLIYAAPDLLAACKAINAAVDDCGYDCRQGDVMEALKLVCAAVAKAAGSSLSPVAERENES